METSQHDQQQSNQLSTSTVKKVAFTGAMDTPAGGGGPFSSTPIHQSTGNRVIIPIPLIQTPLPSGDKEISAETPSDSDLEAQWTSETNQRLVSLREQLHKAGFRQVKKLDPVRLGYVLFTPNSVRTELMFKMFRKIHTPRPFWMTDPKASTAREAQLADRFLTVSKWYGLTSKLEVITGDGSEQDQFNFWGNLIATSHLLSRPLPPPTLTAEDHCQIYQFTHSTAVENLLNSSRNSGNPVTEASESIGPLKTLCDIFQNGAQRAERDIAELSNTVQGNELQNSGDNVDLSAIGNSLIQNFELIRKVVETEENKNKTSEPAHKEDDNINWTNLGDNAGFVVEMMRNVKILSRPNNRQDGPDPDLP